VEQIGGGREEGREDRESVITETGDHDKILTRSTAMPGNDVGILAAGFE